MLRHIEKPAIAAIPPKIKYGQIAAADNGRKEKNTIKNFFNLLISINYITILSRV